jgi:hypothetical protein
VDLFPRIAVRAPTLSFNFKSVDRIAESEYVALGLSPDHWRPLATDHYRFALSWPELDGLLCSLLRPSHVGALVDALDSGPLTDEEQTYMVDLADLRNGRAALVPGA